MGLLPMSCALMPDNPMERKGKEKKKKQKSNPRDLPAAFLSKRRPHSCDFRFLQSLHSVRQIFQQYSHSDMAKKQASVASKDAVDSSATSTTSTSSALPLASLSTSTGVPHKINNSSLIEVKGSLDDAIRDVRQTSLSVPAVTSSATSLSGRTATLRLYPLLPSCLRFDRAYKLHLISYNST